MVSKKIQLSNVIDLESDKSIHEIISEFNEIGLEKLKKSINNLHSFENYILEYFYEGISTNNSDYQTD